MIKKLKLFFFRKKKNVVIFSWEEIEILFKFNAYGSFLFKPKSQF